MHLSLWPSLACPFRASLLDPSQCRKTTRILDLLDDYLAPSHITPGFIYVNVVFNLVFDTPNGIRLVGRRHHI